MSGNLVIVQGEAVECARALMAKGLAQMEKWTDRKLSPNIEKLQARIIELEEVLGLTIVVPIPGLKPMQRKLLGLLLNRKFVSWEAAFLALYEPSSGKSMPDRRVLNVHLCEVRNWLDKYGIKVSTVVGEGAFMKPEMQRKLKALLDGQGEYNGASGRS